MTYTSSQDPDALMAMECEKTALVACDQHISLLYLRHRQQEVVVGIGRYRQHWQVVDLGALMPQE